MRIALYDNLANNSYIQAKAFHRRGIPVDLILDPLDRYVMSDPAWEDLDIELPTDRLTTTMLPRDRRPRWILDDSRPPTASLNEARARGLIDGLRVVPAIRRAGRVAGLEGVRAAVERAWAIQTMRHYDCVIAWGFGAALTRMAGVPAVIQPWGGDVMQLPFVDKNLDVTGRAAAEARLQRWGLRGAGRIAYPDPRFLPALERLGAASRARFVPLVVDTEKYADGDEPALRTELLAGAHGPLILVPARQDWYWKGSDNMLRGFAAVAAHHRGARLVCAGWGADLERSRALAAELGLRDCVRFLPHALSKTRLLRHLRAADIVLDQFGGVGSYGTTTLEAMSTARPLLIHLDLERFAGVFGEDLPPVANCRTPEQIAAALDVLLSDAACRRGLGQRARDWVMRHHGDANVDRTLELCTAAVRDAAWITSRGARPPRRRRTSA